MANKRVSEKKVVMSTGAAAVPARRKSVRTARPASAVEVSSTPEVVSVAESVQTVGITTDAVAQLAYSYWVARSYQGGSPEEDWLRAEQELRAATASK
jgi:hypothetical protein